MNNIEVMTTTLEGRMLSYRTLIRLAQRKLYTGALTSQRAFVRLELVRVV
jgi:hypothetical protein